MNIVHNRHRHEGGTFVTNFSGDMLPVYQTAVDIYQRLSEGVCGLPKRTLILSDIPAPLCPRNYGGSLHLVGDRFDLSDFWRVFDVVRLMKEKA